MTDMVMHHVTPFSKLKCIYRYFNFWILFESFDF